MKAQPAIGHPCKSGLSVKLLGRTEYERQKAEIKRRERGISPRRFTGLSVKVLGWSEYSRRYRILKGKNKTGRTYIQPSKAKP